MSKFDSARHFLRRVLEGEESADPAAPHEPPAPLPSAPGRSTVDAEFAELLESVGAESADGRVDFRDHELAELREMLARLRPLGDELARTERERLRLTERCAELERRQAQFEQLFARQDEELAELREAKDPDPSRREASLLRRLEEREGVLARERERLAQARRQRDERNQVAADRWRELRALRSRLRALELERSE